MDAVVLLLSLGLFLLSVGLLRFVALADLPLLAFILCSIVVVVILYLSVTSRNQLSCTGGKKLGGPFLMLIVFSPAGSVNYDCDA